MHESPRTPQTHGAIFPPASLSWDNKCMQATVELPEAVLRQLEVLASREGATAVDLIRRLFEAHVANSQPPVQRSLNVPLPLIPAAETGPIQPVTGQDVDELLSRDHFTS